MYAACEDVLIFLQGTWSTGIMGVQICTWHLLSVCVANIAVWLYGKLILNGDIQMTGSVTGKMNNWHLKTVY
jgi:type VI protein secretion system component VasK